MNFFFLPSFLILKFSFAASLFFFMQCFQAHLKQRLKTRQWQQNRDDRYLFFMTVEVHSEKVHSPQSGSTRGAACSFALRSTFALNSCGGFFSASAANRDIQTPVWEDYLINLYAYFPGNCSTYLCECLAYLQWWYRSEVYIQPSRTTSAPFQGEIII